MPTRFKNYMNQELINFVLIKFCLPFKFKIDNPAEVHRVNMPIYIMKLKNSTPKILWVYCVFLVFKPRVCFAIEEDSWIRIFILGSCTLLQYTHICVVKCMQIWSLISIYFYRSEEKSETKQDRNQRKTKINYDIQISLFSVLIFASQTHQFVFWKGPN